MKRLLFILAFLPALAQAQHFASCPLDHYIMDKYENPLFQKYLSKYDVKFYHLSLEVSNTDTYIEGFTTILLKVENDLDTLVFQLIDALTVDEIQVNSSQIQGFEHRDDAIYIPVSAEVGESLTVRIYYNGDASQDRGFFAGISSKQDATGFDVTYTLSEPLNARDWFPVKQVLMDKADSVWVDLTCSKDLMAGSIGVLKEIESVSASKHKFKWRSNYPIAYYLISLSVSDYRDYSIYAPLSDENDSVLVQNFIYDDDGYFDANKAKIDRTADLIHLYSDLVIDYPFSNEKYGHCVAPMGGGMEHQTMTTLSGFSFTLVAHELAHQWFGDNITCGNWQDIWINEGFASYFEYIALQNLESQEKADDWMQYAMALAFEENDGSVYVPENNAEDVYRVFDYSLSYKKGATLLHMIRYEVNNDSMFFRILKEYSEKFADSLATATEFKEVLEELSGIDFSCFFDQWYYGKGYPTFDIKWYKRNDTLFIQSNQSSSSATTPLFRMTFDISVDTEGSRQVYRLYQDEKEEVFEIPLDSYVWDVSFDPDNWLLAKNMVSELYPDERQFLVGPNPFSEHMYLRFRNSTGQEYLEIYNLEGKLVHSQDITSNPYELDLNFLQDGPYLLKVNTESGSFKEKILKIRSR